MHIVPERIPLGVKFKIAVLIKGRILRPVQDDGSPLQMFAKVSTEGYRKVTGTVNVLDDQGNPTGQTEEIQPVCS